MNDGCLGKSCDEEASTIEFARGIVMGETIRTEQHTALPERHQRRSLDFWNGLSWRVQGSQVAALFSTNRRPFRAHRRTRERAKRMSTSLSCADVHYIPMAWAHLAFRALAVQRQVCR